MPQLLVSDANIVIDIHCGVLIDRIFALRYEFAIPDLLFEEELKVAYPTLPQQGFRILELAAEGVDLVVRLSVKHARSGCSRNDLFALALAVQEHAPLLTGDARLRELCKAEGREVHGTLWLVQQLHDAQRLTALEARQAYEAMQAQGRRLPWVEIERQLRTFR